MKDLKRSEVYFLFSKNESDEDEVYIGRSGIEKMVKVHSLELMNN